MATAIIYGIKNLANGKWYIGQTIDIKRRKKYHISYFKRNCHQNEHLQSSWNKYGADNFEFRILEEVTEDMLDAREMSWIEYYKSNIPQYGYNMESGGRSGLGKRPSIITRQKISNVIKLLYSAGYKNPRKGSRHTETSLKKMSEAHKGRTAWNKGMKTGKLLQATCQKMSAARMGRKLSIETRLKISEKAKNRKRTVPVWNKGMTGIYHPSDETRNKMRNAMLGAKNHNYGKAMSDQQRHQISISQKLRLAKKREET